MRKQGSLDAFSSLPRDEEHEAALRALTGLGEADGDARPAAAAAGPYDATPAPAYDDAMRRKGDEERQQPQQPQQPRQAEAEAAEAVAPDGRPRQRRASGPIGAEAPGAPRGDQARAARASNGAHRNARPSQDAAPQSTGGIDPAELKYGASAVVALLKPITVTMVLVVIILKTVDSFSEDKGKDGFAGAAHEDTSGDASAGEQASGAILNTLIILGTVIAMTTVLVTLFYFKWYKALGTFLVIVMAALLGLFTYLTLLQIIVGHNGAFDVYSLSIIIWNYGAVGLIHLAGFGWKRVQQVYHITLCVTLSLVLQKSLPEYTLWILLAAISCWDLVAVLCPYGPLRILVETAQDREVAIPQALIYSTMLWVTMAQPGKPKPGPDPANLLDDAAGAGPSGGGSRPAATQPARPVRPSAAEEEDEGSGPKLGLGDFIFYSILIGAAAIQDDWGTIFSCYIAIVVGLILTLFILVIHGKALPALPFSIFFGLIFRFTCALMISPMFDQTNVDNIFV